MRLLGPRLAIVDVRSGRLTRLDARRVYDQQPAWSPDGRRLALGQYRGPVFTVAANGAGYRPLPVTGSFVSWLPDGNLLVGRGTSAHSIAVLPQGRGPARTMLTLPYRQVIVSLVAAR